MTTLSGISIEAVDRKLLDPNFFERNGDVSSEVIKAIRKGLLDIPEPLRSLFLDSEFQISAGSDAYYHDLFRAYEEIWRSPAGQCIRKENAKMFFGRPTLVICSDSDLDEIIYATRHEIGHGADHIKAGYNYYQSARSSLFREAARHYLMRNADRTATKIYFTGERRLRHDHLPLYGIKDGRINDALYKELAAEFFNKFCAYYRRFGYQAADTLMAASYAEAWAMYKQEVLPEIVKTEQTELERFQDPEATPDTTFTPIQARKIIQLTPPGLWTETQKGLYFGVRDVQPHIWDCVCLSLAILSIQHHVRYSKKLNRDIVAIPGVQDIKHIQAIQGQKESNSTSTQTNQPGEASLSERFVGHASDIEKLLKSLSPSSRGTPDDTQISYLQKCISDKKEKAIALPL